MRSTTAAGAALLVAFAAAQPGVARCLDKYQCAFLHDIAGTEYSWDFSPLCIESPEQSPPSAIGSCTTWRAIGPESSGMFVCDVGQDRMVRSLGANFTFNICGNTTAVCAFSPDSPLYDSRGVAVQQFGPRPSDPNPTVCTDWDTGAVIPCTEMCAVVGTPFHQFTLVDTSNPTGGVVIRHDAMPPNALDPFGECPPGDNGLLRERSMTFVIACDQSTEFAYDTTAKSPDPLQADGLVLYEYPQCAYTIFLRSARACGVAAEPCILPSPSTIPTHTPFPSLSFLPTRTPYPTQSVAPAPLAAAAPAGAGTFFGFTVLGAALTVTLGFAYSVGEHRGWWDPIKARIPGLGYGGYKASFGAGAGARGPPGGGAAPFSSSSGTAYGS